MENMIKLTRINYQEWHTFMTYNIVRKDSTTADIYVDSAKIITFKKITSKKSRLIHKDFPTYTHISLLGSEFGIDVSETPEEILKILNN